MTHTEKLKNYIFRTKEARISANKTQKEMAANIGVDRTTYTNYERFRPMPHKYIAKFCITLNITEKWLLTGEGPMQYNLERQSTIKKIEALSDKRFSAIKAIVDSYEN